MSRYPVHGSHVYDLGLVESGPDLTKQDRQQGYDLNLVLQQPHRPHPQRGLQPQLPYHSSRQFAPPSIEKADYYSSHASPIPKPPKPWYRTRRGLVTLIVLLLVLIGVAVGTAVAVTNNAHANSKSAPTSPEKGGEAESAIDPNAPPALPSLSLVRLDTTQAAAPAVAPTDLVITPNANRGTAASAAI